ncbi:unnamed protein product [Peronospora belbahrii]|uniref:SCP domain-containing protein n=1 Tax=Peronospora belbahrii TaxID=622444 RepID=A0ABN8CT39_9STRA|nr:unnamed protein product [Peronospora belbahrii]
MPLVDGNPTIAHGSSALLPVWPKSASLAAMSSAVVSFFFFASASYCSVLEYVTSCISSYLLSPCRFRSSEGDISQRELIMACHNNHKRFVSSVGYDSGQRTGRCYNLNQYGIYKEP